MPETLRDLRTSAGLTLACVASDVGTDHATLSKVERGKLRPSIPLLVAVANRYGLSDADLGRLLRSLAPEGAPLPPEAQS